MKSGRARCHILGTILLVFSLQVLCEDAPALSAPSPKATPVLLTSYLPAAMQVLAHLSNQMTYPASPSAKPSTLTTARPATTQHTTPKTTTTSTTLSPKATTHKLDLTTKSHGPANYAPFAPPPQRAVVSEPAFHHPIPPLISDTYPHHLLLPELHETDHIVPVIRSPYPQHSPHYIRDPYPIQETHFPVVLFPSHTYYQPKSPNSEPVFLPGHYDHVYKQDSVFNDWLTKARQGNDETFYIPGENIPNFASIPVENENNFKLNPLELTPDELSDENLQFLSPNVRELVKGINGVDAEAGEGKLNPSANYQSIEELFDNPDERKNVAEWLKVQKALVTQSYIKMILLYDLLSTDAKSQKLNNYNGYTPEILKDLEDASKGSAADQLKTVLDRMIARGDCKYEFANNRAKELAQDLGKPGSTAYMEVQRLEPLKFNV